MFKRREEIAKLLDKGLEVDEFRDELSEIVTIESADLGRVISISKEVAEDYLKLEEDEIVTGLGNSWTDRDDEHMGGFIVENEDEVEINFFVSNARGYKLQYFSEFIMDEDIAYDIQDNDEVYEELMDTLGSSYEMYSEAEVIVNSNAEYKVVGVYDERDEVGSITVELEMI